MAVDDQSLRIKEPPENFLRVHYFYRTVPEVLWQFWKNKDVISPHIFTYKECNGGLSNDWSKYCNPEDTKYKRTNPKENTGVMQFNLGNFFDMNEREQFNLTLEHKPLCLPTIEYPFTNRAHSLIHGINEKTFKTVVQRELTDICSWVESCKPEELKLKKGVY